MFNLMFAALILCFGVLLADNWSRFWEHMRVETESKLDTIISDMGTLQRVMTLQSGKILCLNDAMASLQQAMVRRSAQILILNHAMARNHNGMPLDPSITKARRALGQSKSLSDYASL
jgi:hypothetical protein